MIYCACDIECLRKLAKEYNLETSEEFALLTNEELADICNGVGPGKWSRWVRRALTYFAGDYAVVSAIHDVQQEFCSCDHKAAAEIFVKNALKICFYRQGGRWQKIVIHLAGWALKTFGGKFWKEVKS